MVSGIEIIPLTRAGAEHFGPALLQLNAGNDWDYWSMENLLADRPGKWELSSVAMDGGEPVGYVVVSKVADGAHMHHMVVAAAWRARSLGLRLLSHTMGLLQREGIGRVSLKVYKDHAGTLRMYELLKFEVREDSSAGLMRLTADVASAIRTLALVAP